MSMSDQNRAMAEGDRRLAQLIQFGTIAEVDHDAARIRVSLGGEARSAWIPWITGRAGDVRIYSAPSIGEQVMLLSPSGNGAQGVALLGIYGDSSPPPSAAPATTRIDLPAGVSIEISGGKVAIAAPSGVEIDGDVIVRGDVIADGISLKTHVHGGVSRGGSSTDEPTE